MAETACTGGVAYLALLRTVDRYRTAVPVMSLLVTRDRAFGVLPFCVN